MMVFMKSAETHDRQQSALEELQKGVVVMDKLKPCPFCGSKNITIKDSENGVDEIEAWNRRSTNQ